MTDNTEHPGNVVAFKSVADQEKEYLTVAAAEFNQWLSALADGVSTGAVTIALVSYYTAGTERTEQLRFTKNPADLMAAIGMLSMQLHGMLAEMVETGALRYE